MRQRLVLLIAVLSSVCSGRADAAEGTRSARSFLSAKTMFQTNVGYDPRLAIAVDGVVVHRHGAPKDDVARWIGSWKEHGFMVGRMFFADSDGSNEYWKGKWDGTPHEDEVERRADGKVVLCSGVRPYMLPTEGWIRYLEEMAVESIDAGADAILPEEPLAHVNTGYEEAFRKLWVIRYGREWEPESSSAEARFMTARLKNELYIELERRLAKAVERRGQELGRDITFVLPIHSIYSNVAAKLVAPLGTSTGIEGVDGYIGQVWTGPVNWAAHHYDSPDRSFFGSAYLLYDYFVQLAVASDRKLWLLVDPVEDNPEHEWSEFEEWYRHCVAAQLMLPEVDAFEVMPWPDRIFLPGYRMASGTPAPERFRVIVLSATQVMQEVPARGEWEPSGEGGAGVVPTEGVGVAMADTLMWETEPFPSLQPAYGMLMPLVQAGVPVSTCVTERIGEADYISRFKTIVLSYEAWKPADAEMNGPLAKWVKGGGSLIVLGGGDDYEGESFCWRKDGHATPLHQMMAELGIREVDENGDHAVGRGWVLRRTISPRRFGDPAIARDVYLPLVAAGLTRAGGGELTTPGAFCLRRGPFVVAHATREAVKLRGKYVNLFEPDLPVVEEVVVEPGTSGVYRDVAATIAAKGEGNRRPCILHTTHRLMSEQYRSGVLRAVVRGPAETPAVVRVFTADRTVRDMVVRDDSGNKLEVKWSEEGSTVLARFPNVPAGATLLVRWK